MWISWKQKFEDLPSTLEYEDKVDIFYDQTLGWQLHIADLIANGGTTFGDAKPVQDITHSGFAVLQICLSYFELIGTLYEPETPSRELGRLFKLGVRTVFPELSKDTSDNKELLNLLYTKGRCGLYHQARTRFRVGLGPTQNDKMPIEYDPTLKIVRINPKQLPRVLKDHLQRLKEELLDPTKTDLKRKFTECYDKGFDDKPSSTQLATPIYRQISVDSSAGAPQSRSDYVNPFPPNYPVGYSVINQVDADETLKEFGGSLLVEKREDK